MNLNFEEDKIKKPIINWTDDPLYTPEDLKKIEVYNRSYRYSIEGDWYTDIPMFIVEQYDIPFKYASELSRVIPTILQGIKEVFYIHYEAYVTLHIPPESSFMILSRLTFSAFKVTQYTEERIDRIATHVKKLLDFLPIDHTSRILGGFEFIMETR